MSSDPPSARPTSDRAGGESSAGRWLATLVPEWVARRGLAITVRAPERIVVGDRQPIVVSVRNRLPVPVAFSLPTGRLWGWAVDGVPEADRRGFEPPAANRRLALSRGERRVFSAEWDGRFRESGTSGDIWRAAPGEYTLTGYLAFDRWDERGLYAERTVTVVE
ncbi:hypothetical protein [Halococcus agarilyticus]|uniref:hypothetical protein n=1 Tax=Halococcus agarilyticus TaxID=1232219 RepID=UPI00067796D2|nr:hypothetical protein [Halococcus agarilyticus]